MPTLNHTTIAIKAKADNTNLVIRYGDGLQYSRTIPLSHADSAKLLADKINRIREPEDLIWLGFFVSQVAEAEISNFTNAIIEGSL